MTIKELRAKSGMTQKQFAAYFNIPKRSIENWEEGHRKCPQYVVELAEYKLKNDGKLKKEFTQEDEIRMAVLSSFIEDESRKKQFQDLYKKQHEATKG